MPPIAARLEDGWMRALEHLPLAFVPLATALFAGEKIGRVVAFRGVHFGARIALPVDVVDVWAFVSVPADGVNLWLSMPTGSPFALVAVPATVLLRAALSAGYFGSIRAALETGEYDFAGNVRRHFVPFLLYTLLPVLAAVPLLALGAGGSPRALLPLLAVLFPVVLILSYLFFATPYLVVLRETDLVSAARASYGFAVDGGPYVRYALGFGAFVLLVSLVLTAVVVNLQVAGVLLGVTLGAPLGLACNVATMQFVADVDPESPSLGDVGNGAGGRTADSTADDRNHHR